MCTGQHTHITLSYLDMLTLILVSVPPMCYCCCCCWLLLYNTIFHSWADSLCSYHMRFWMSDELFMMHFLNIHQSGVLTALFGCYMAGATRNCYDLCTSVLCTPYNHAPCMWLHAVWHKRFQSFCQERNTEKKRQSVRNGGEERQTRQKKRHSRRGRRTETDKKTEGERGVQTSQWWLLQPRWTSPQSRWQHRPRGPPLSPWRWWPWHQAAPADRWPPVELSLWLPPPLPVSPPQTVPPLAWTQNSNGWEVGGGDALW